jgi:hypothetical protein
MMSSGPNRHRHRLAGLLLCAQLIPSAFAQTVPTPEQFNVAVRTCVASQNITLSNDIIQSVIQQYQDHGSSGSLENSSEFISTLPEDSRLEAYRFYADCVAKILSQNANLIPAPTTVVYKVCSGEYERACQQHDAYLYCYTDVNRWAESRCESYKIQRLNVYGGNKCGYSLDAVICTGPK